MTKTGLCLGAAALVLTAAMSAHAAEYHVDPNAESAGDGSESNPWASLQNAIDNGSVAAGDTVWLMSGEYGELKIASADNADMITIAAADRQEPAFTRVLVDDSTAWTLRGLHVRGEDAGYLIDLGGNNENVRVEDCVLMSTADASNWSAQDWIDRASSGIRVDGTRMTIRNNHLRNVAYGISVGADNSLVEGNLIENFSRDGLRGLGDHSVFQYNTVKNSMKVDDHHDDGFQSWSVGDGGVGTGEVVGIVLRGNTFINFENPDQPHRGSMQGIGCFDGTFVDWVIENNVVLTDHWHGITLLGARNSTIINNTVMDLNENGTGPPWIKIDNHKDGTAPTGCVVRNNLTTALRSSNQVIEENNITLSMDEAAAFFVDPGNLDYHLLGDAPAIDAGTATGAPNTDRDLIPRPQGAGIDIGAYEWHDGTVDPVPPPDLIPPPRSGGDGSEGSGGTPDSGASGSVDNAAAQGTSSAGGGGCGGGCGVQGHTRHGAGVLLLLSLAVLVRRRR